MTFAFPWDETTADLSKHKDALTQAIGKSVVKQFGRGWFDLSLPDRRTRVERLVNNLLHYQ